MKVEFSHEEYRALMELLYLGEWVLHSYVEDEGEKSPVHQDLLQRIYSGAHRVGCGDLVEKDGSTYFETQEFEDEVHPHLDFYEDQLFWDELSSRLARRDMLRAVGREALEAMDPAERVVRVFDYEAPWADELETHGLARLTVDTSVDAGEEK